ncbi:hypothetical protein [Acaryochloris marina]|uniref:Uncharacterized protein n=1 Tax=Acaryochloris marina (strain MBIC 11017) TaxID=329726 RepID=B0BYH2_ACAM1|nr:hypothetical protein [Acaryochloris marina]ABW25857.1 hypothetical protein AM1_0813 [Acaryochloris marina MBIC11017]BDM80719.1 hypothetical protein AM10699_35870 [Acaryochloris marina MBIC10699]
MEITLDQKTTWHLGGEAHVLHLLRLVAQINDENWSAVSVVLECAPVIAARGEELSWFHNRLESRLDWQNRPFLEDLPVRMEIALRPEYYPRLPCPSSDAVQRLTDLFVIEPPPSPELFDDAVWNAIQLWQEYPIDPSIGGGTMRVGYRTAFSMFTDEVDRLRRRGPVSRIIVDALIESGIPISWIEEDPVFTVTLYAEDRGYLCRIRPNESSSGITVSVEWIEQLSDAGVAKLSSHIAVADTDLVFGSLTLVDGRIRLDNLTLLGPSITEETIIETLRAAVSALNSKVNEWSELDLTAG